MNAETIHEVVNNLVGQIRPVGATHIDDKRLENLKVFIEVFDKRKQKNNGKSRSTSS